jgi:hypothetical protein
MLLIIIIDPQMFLINHIMEVVLQRMSGFLSKSVALDRVMINHANV